MTINIDVPQLVRADDNERVSDRNMVTLRMYRPPLDGTPDIHEKFDRFVADRMEEILKHHYPGYPWKGECDASQGVVYFGIPLLMGPTLNWVIRLAEWGDLNPKLVIDGGGELLERCNLPRKGFEVSSFLHARDNRHELDFSDVGRSKSVDIGAAPRSIQFAQTLRPAMKQLPPPHRMPPLRKDNS